MAFIVFIGGLLEHNSGKTTVARDMVNFFKKNSAMKISPFKPLSGNNLFYHYDQIKKNTAEYKDFVSLDIAELLHETSNETKATIANPVHKVNTQAIATRFFEEGSISAFYNKYQDSEALIQRFSFCDEAGNQKSTYIVNEPIYKNRKFWNDEVLTESILKKASEIKFFKNDQEYYSLNSKYYADSIQTSFEYLKKNSDLMVIESFNNSAHPAWCVRESNVILLLGPGSIFIYEPDVYFRAIDNFRAINRNKPSTTNEVLKIASPKEALYLPLDETDRLETVTKLANQIKDTIG
ncbi:MAG: hypothetical protein KGD64_05090 [Candidatus Heimdallarchaeota archaeon]|nr:hypothetical protein [Candidatus Heimdallarchaeota archaeon]